MIPKITKGSRPFGILTYLVGPGRHNEHTDPHLVAGSPVLMAWFDDAQLSTDSAVELAKEVDLNRRVMGFDSDMKHVWQCSLSLRADEGELGDDKWHDVAQSFMDEMDFTEAGGKSPCTWMAIHHGQSRNGNDHIHIVASRVREDGTKWAEGNDFRRAQNACRRLERDFDLLQVSGNQSQRWLSRPEHERAVAEREEPSRFRMERVVRACAVSADSEAQFVRRMRRANLLVYPRFASGSDSVVTGFSVAERPAKGMKPLRIGGGRLAKDLTLTALRTRWDDSVPSAVEASDEWRAAKRNHRIVHSDPSVGRLDSETANRMASELREVRRRMRAVPANDHQQWVHVARETSGVLAAWSLASEDGRNGPLARASRILSRSAQRSDTRFEPLDAPLRLAGTAAFMVAMAQAPQPVAQAMVLNQLVRMMQSIYEMHQANQDVAEMQRLNDTFEHDLAEFAAPLPDVPEEHQHAGPIKAPAQLRETHGPEMERPKHLTNVAPTTGLEMER